MSNVKLVMGPSQYTAGKYISYCCTSGTHIFMCSNGVGRSGTFCALVISINRFKAGQMVDVFRTIKTMRTNRPKLVTNAVSK